jgi:hypothetical protein
VSATRPTLDVSLRDPEAAGRLPRAALVELMAEAAAVQSTIVSRLVAAGDRSSGASTNGAAPGATSPPDKMLTVGEAARCCAANRAEFIATRSACRSSNACRASRCW